MGHKPHCPWELCDAGPGKNLVALQCKRGGADAALQLSKALLNQILESYRTREVTIAFLAYFTLARPDQTGYTQSATSRVAEQEV